MFLNMGVYIRVGCVHVNAAACGGQKKESEDLKCVCTYPCGVCVCAHTCGVCACECSCLWSPERGVRGLQTLEIQGVVTHQVGTELSFSARGEHAPNC